MKDYAASKSEDQEQPPRLQPRGAQFKVAILILLLGVAGVTAYLPGQPVGDGSKRISFEVKPGSGSARVAANLKAANLIGNPQYFRLLLKVTGRSTRVQAGIYALNDGMSTGEIADVLTEGKVRLFALTIPEGWNRRQIGDYLVEKGMLQSRAEFIELTENPDILRKYNIPASSSEGYLFPDTYHVPDGYSAEAFQELMIKKFFEKLAAAEPPADLNPTELHRQIILASMVEREAYHPRERPLMAQVFLNRLDQGMRLESCATIQYLLKKPRARLYDKDLQIKSPYNTYLHAGLPPGPISSPGLDALRAVFHPTPTENLFFVLKSDRSHHFSATFQEHVRAKKQYLNR